MFRLLLAPLYPLLVHLAVLRHSAGLAAAALLLLAALSLFTPLREGRRGAWLALAIIALALAAAWHVGSVHALLYLPPLVFPALVLWAFAESLRPGRTALVSVIATQIQGPLPPAVQAYTRRVTWLWTLVIAALLGTNLLLSFGPSQQAWSAFTNGGDYLLIAAVFLLEYAWRRLRFPELEQPSFPHYLRQVLQHRPGPA